MVTGSYSSDVKFWDFGGMRTGIHAFRTIEPDFNHSIVALDFNCSGSNLLVCNNSWQAKIYDREGSKVSETPKGYTYISDLSNTNGHVSPLTGGRFHRFEDNIFATSSLDGSLRLWDSEKLKKHTAIYKMRTKQGRKLQINSFGFSKDCNMIAVGLISGAIPIYSLKKSPHSAPIFNLSNAHSENSEICSVDFSPDNLRLLTRGMDESCKIFDLKMPNKPLKAIEGMSTKYVR